MQWMRYTPGQRSWREPEEVLSPVGQTHAGSGADNLELNRAIAYEGKIGRQREDFCIQYAKCKQERFREIEVGQIKRVEASGEAITCKKGCTFCCLVYVEASIQDCEAIVYYLYHNESVLSVFLDDYPRWKDSARRNGNLFERCEQAAYAWRVSGQSEEALQAFADALLFYKMQDIPCPFLHDHTCLIYEVRPDACAAHHATTPAEWCSPFHPNQPKVYRATPATGSFDVSLFYRRLDRPVFLCMPAAVYEILQGGYVYLSAMPGLEGLADEVMEDAEVRATLKQRRPHR
jgi:Fe-S-cluster containining protein